MIKTCLLYTSGTDSNNVQKVFEINETGGEYEHTLTGNEMPAHNHRIFVTAKDVYKRQSWFDIGFFSFQPGEFAKIFVILFLTYAIRKVQERNRQDINRPRCV